MPATDLDGTPLLDVIGMKANGGKDLQLTLGRAVQHALTWSHESERDVSGAEKFRRGKLALEIHEGKCRALKAGDIELIKKLVAMLYGPTVVLRAYPLLDPAEE